MKRLLYIGQLNPGSTCAARLAAIEDGLPDWEIETLDTWTPLSKTSRLARTLAWRLRLGPAVDAENHLIVNALRSRSGLIDCVWVDKGVLIRSQTLKRIRERAGTLVHYTPDAAFFANRSRHFERGMPHYDLLVTTKSFELAHYSRRVPEQKVLLVTQGYDRRIHYPRHTQSEKRTEAIFVGLAEPHREESVRAMLAAGITVAIAGYGWKRFAQQHASPLLRYLGESLFGDAYAEALSSASVGLGFLSHRFPERHTTRTFEIPACGTVLATERNSETESFFKPDAALFYSESTELVSRVASCIADAERLETIARQGRETVEAGQYSYHDSIDCILKSIGLNTI